MDPTGTGFLGNACVRRRAPGNAPRTERFGKASPALDSRGDDLGKGASKAPPA
jgi:hypothetical protein